ncbi:tumor necrosis factor receptor superfamily member 5 isoform X2 [Antechinus flavipes]|uniref:tumor necrosis factor receptor superfamily member 5 isoform X2 n=1 Tax=Antechinus flavipes TaxID=38775 RepID=UPI0022368A4D|nr:tumor necrosis factor receptor superfamily member 5 isoform X2 [Antechinus flavipes]
MIPFCLLWACVFTAVHMKPAISCEKNQYLVNGLCCEMCSPGTKLVTDCSEGSETQCEPCQEGEFQSSWNHDKYCHQHKYCHPNMHLKIQKEGSLEKDTTCVCIEGFHCTSPECESCSSHSPCQPGFGVKHAGTNSTDTICEPCKKGFFSNVSSAFEKCLPWTSCKDTGLSEVQEGTDKTDVLCQSLCFKAPKNKVLQKMEPIETDEDPLPVQETLLRGQPVTQEDGKESRISEQEGQ